MMRHLAGAIFLVVLGAGVAVSMHPGAAAQPQRPRMPELSIKVGEPFPPLTLPALKDGIRKSIADFRGQKVILHIFASW